MVFHQLFNERQASFVTRQLLLKAMLQPAYFSCSAFHADFNYIKRNITEIFRPGLQPGQRRLFDFLPLCIGQCLARRAVCCAGPRLYFHKMHGASSPRRPISLHIFHILPKSVVRFVLISLCGHQVQFAPAAMIIPFYNTQAFPFQEFRGDFFASFADFLFG